MGILKSWPSWLSWGSGDKFREDGDLARALDGGFAGNIWILKRLINFDKYLC